MRPALSLVLLLLLAAPRPAIADEPVPECRKRHEAALAAYVTELDTLAKWCQRNGLYAVRDMVFRDLLLYDTEHAAARKRLKYKKVDGEWVQSDRYKHPKNFKPKNLPEYKKRRAEVEAGLATALDAVWALCTSLDDLAWAETAAGAWGERRPDDEAPAAALRGIRLKRYQALWGAGKAAPLAALETVLKEAYPEDDGVRTLLDEVEHEGDVILAETHRAIARRQVLLAAAKKAVADHADAALDELGRTDLELGLLKLKAFKSKHIRAAGTIPEAALKAFVASMEGAAPFFEAALGKAPDRRERLNAYLFAGVDELDAFIDRFPKADPALMKQQKEHGLHLFWANGNTLGAGPLAPKAQTELALGVQFMLFFADTWFGHDNLPGWLDEGLARHLSFLMTGTRFGIAVGGRYGAQDPTVTRDIPDAHGNWMKSGHARLGKLKSWELRLLLGKGIDAYNGIDGIKAYVLAVYLIEGRHEKAVPFLERLAAGDDPDLASRKILGLPLTILEHRMRRFLAELAAR